VFADAPFAAVPFAARRATGNSTFDSIISELASAAEYQANGNIFLSNVAETNNAADFFATIGVLASEFSETVTGSDSIGVGPSTFNGDISEIAQTFDFVLAGSVYLANITEGVVAADQISSALLWELINNAQTADWGTINNLQTPGWTVISNEQTDTWQLINTQG
jgi:hypothetical protein